jgi:HK97 family phage major capsid protein/HK97 family phage prohead protease
MPTPHPSDETRDEWMSRCIPFVLDDGSADDHDQAVAMCSSMWEDATKSKGAKMNRAYSLLTVKAVDNERRVITGIATTPTPDRVGDVVEPMGVKFNNPMPLLHQHKAELPVGTVTFQKPTKDGIKFEARLPNIEIDGPLKDRVDMAWQEIKAGLVRGVSIGFRSLEASMMEDGGIHFLQTEVMELSLVTIPANADTVIQTIKQYDVGLPASGEAASGETVLPASREKSKPQPKTPRRTSVRNYTEQIAAFEKQCLDKSTKMAEIQQKAADDGRNKDEAEKEEFDTLRDEIKALEIEIEDLKEMERIAKSTVKAVVATTPEDGTNSRQPDQKPQHITVRECPGMPKGIAFARMAKCKALAALDHASPFEVAKTLYPDHTELHAALVPAYQKTAVAAAMTSVTAWAGALVNVSSIAADFVEYLRPMTIIGQFGVGNVPSLRRVPFRTILASQTAGTTGYWVGEGQPKPVSKATFTTTSLVPYKAAAIAVATMELLRDSSPSAEGIIRDDIAKAVAAKIDSDFLDPQKGLETNVSPASISNGLTPINSSGRDADSVRADIVTAFAAFLAVNNTPSTGVWIMSAVTALQLSLLTNALGQPEFPGMGMKGGTLNGLPVITSEFLAYTEDSPTTGRDVFLVNASDIWFADDGGIDVSMSTEASLQMDDAPTNASGSTVTATSLVSMWQTNSVAFRAERSVSWARRRTEAVQYIAQVEWGEASGVNV